MRKYSIGILMITKNAQKYLSECLQACAWADEIVILDSGSTDQTEQIARKFTNKFYIDLNWEGFGKQRQKAQKYLCTDWVLGIDADEIISEELKNSILSNLETSDKNCCFQINRLSKAFGKFIHYSGWYPDYLPRLYPRNLTSYDDKLVHEAVLIPKGIDTKLLQGELLHYTFENIQEYSIKSNFYSKLWVKEHVRKKSSSLVTAITHAIACFFRMYIFKKGFLDGKHGLLLAILYANATFTRYADLWIENKYYKK